MNAAMLQQKLYAAYASVARKTGATYTLYRPTSPHNPIVSASIVTTLPASFNAEDMRYQKAETYGKALWYCLADGMQLRVGDYLVYQGQTYFIASMAALLPILAVKCNRLVRIGRMPAENGAGYAGYSGVVQSAETDVLGTSSGRGLFVAGWPASILAGGRGEQDAGLPSSVKQGGVTILLPASVPIVISESDTMQDDMGRDYVIETAELTDMGWRIQASEEHA